MPAPSRDPDGTGAVGVEAALTTAGLPLMS